VWDEEKEETIVLITNHLSFGSTTIASTYKDRWQIEIFFKTIKQNLKIKTFVGTSPNALMIQIWTALIAVLILKYLKFKSRFAWSISNLVAMLRYNLFTYRDLWAWIDSRMRCLRSFRQVSSLRWSFNCWTAWEQRGSNLIPELAKYPSKIPVLWGCHTLI